MRRLTFTPEEWDGLMRYMGVTTDTRTRIRSLAEFILALPEDPEVTLDPEEDTP